MQTYAVDQLLLPDAWTHAISHLELKHNYATLVILGLVRTVPARAVTVGDSYWEAAAVRHDE
jgi:hypothetical protein